MKGFFVFDRYGYCVGGPFETFFEAAEALRKYENLAAGVPYERTSGWVGTLECSSPEEHNELVRKRIS